MTTRRTVLAVTGAWTATLAGCGQPDDSADTSLSVDATDATGTPGEAVAVTVTARQAAVITYQLGEIPEAWQVTHEAFDPEPTAVRESYPPELTWDPVPESVTGTLTVAVSGDADPGTYDLPVEARAADGEENAVATATITIEE